MILTNVFKSLQRTSNIIQMKKSNSFFGRLILVLSIQLFLSTTFFGQLEPLPCDDPDNFAIGCFCETAGILCTPDELDGFEFAMSDIANSGDLEGDLCPELPEGGEAHNVNFFAFIVWCETLTFDVLVDNCLPGTNTGNNVNNFGIQMALFANCPAANGGNWDPVECITNGGETCFNSAEEVPNIQTFTASGLEIGATYYFMLDGCFRSTCEITIDVQGVCGNGEITPWENGIFGLESACIGDTETYTAEDVVAGLDGAEEYYYYLDGVLIDEGEEQYTIDITWDTPGSYELCVDVSNLPCIQESESLPSSCMTIIVNGPGDGDVQADPTILCPDATSTITVADTNSDPAHSEYIVIIDSDGEVVQIVEALTTTLTYDQCGILTAYYYSFVTADNPQLPAVGDVWTLPDCDANCCFLDDVEITFEDSEDPVFADEPADITLDCVEDIIADEEVTWTDNCAGTGTITPVVEENYTPCGGGTIDRTWTFSDNCANTETYTQTIALDPIPAAEFLSPPSDSSISCDSAQIFTPVNLFYTNMASGACEISGSVSPTSVGTFDLCGGSVTYTWEFTDQCGRAISHSQVVSVEPIPEAGFINPPADITIGCNEVETFIPDTLMYTNGGTGICLIEGTVVPTSNVPLDTCGISVTFTWEYTDLCFRIITHSQTVTVEEDVVHSVQSEENKKEIVIFPNPFNNQITIDEEGLKESDINIYNLVGENVNSMIGLSLNLENVVIETANLLNGIYILKVGSAEKLIYKYSYE